MLKPNIETFIACGSEYENADIVLFGAPFDSTASYRPGARFGPSAIRHESFGIESYSPYQNMDLCECSVFDSGDLELSIGRAELALGQIESRTGTILQERKLPLMIGGEHLVTLGAIRSAIGFFPNLHIIHFDAHADLRQEYLGASLSHACVMRRCHELVGDSRIHQFCIRSGDKSEFEFAREHTDLHLFNFDGLSHLVNELKKKKTPIYLTIDLDCLDPSALPGTGTPEAGGVTFIELLSATLELGGTNIVGADINELAPSLDQSGASTALSCKLLRELILVLSKNIIKKTK